MTNASLSSFYRGNNIMETKMHRYPAVLGGLDASYTVPMIVAIGPYHHHRAELKQAEKVKHAAAAHCVEQSGDLLEELYSAVVPIADEARRLYDQDVMAGIGYEDFRHMMFFDACFVVQFMRMIWGGVQEKIDPSLHRFLSPNRGDIFRDLMLLENQIPWQVVETVMRFKRDDDDSMVDYMLRRFVSGLKGLLQDQVERPTSSERADHVVWDGSYKPPHLLGPLRHYVVRRRGDKKLAADTTNKRRATDITKVSYSISAMELAEIGIVLTANKTKDLIDMGLHQEGTLFAELSLPSLSLDRNRASFLVSMAALEVCTVRRFTKAPAQDSAVCSYLLLLAMLVFRAEDVHELRARALLQGGGGLTNEQALSFFTCLQGLRHGICYINVMLDIDGYKKSRRVQTKLYAFFHNNMKIITAVITGVGAVGGIIGTLLSIKKSI